MDLLLYRFKERIPMPFTEDDRVEAFHVAAMYGDNGEFRNYRDCAPPECLELARYLFRLPWPSEGQRLRELERVGLLLYRGPAPDLLKRRIQYAGEHITARVIEDLRANGHRSVVAKSRLGQDWAFYSLRAAAREIQAYKGSDTTLFNRMRDFHSMLVQWERRETVAMIDSGGNALFGPFDELVPRKIQLATEIFDHWCEMQP